MKEVYVLFHKPRGCVTTLSDPEGRNSVMDYLKGIPQRIYPVGRLDYYSEGLLLLTNDGDVANRIMHPRYEVMKIYEVKTFGVITEELLRKLKKGVDTSDGPLRPHLVRVIKQLPNKTWLEFRLREGKNREIRRLCEIIGISIDKLKRVAIANLSIDGL
ncbi:MAG: pseudouridine synthase, partial [Oligoflexia bacterium]|nr:pseudouridine synthase [Oligoflexia bacterium]